MKEYYYNNREIMLKKQRNRTYKKKYGITADEFDQLFEAQGGTCAICEEARFNKSSPKGCLDHCHKTGKIRAILCMACNTALGNLNDDINLLKKATYEELLANPDTTEQRKAYATVVLQTINKSIQDLKPRITYES